MDRLLDYICWRGDLTFAERGFCDADNLVFCALAYLKFPDECLDGRPRTLRECYDMLLRGRGVEMMTTDTDVSMADVVRRAAESARFGRLAVRDYVDVFDGDPKDPVQFSAVTFELDGQTRFIAFRGTDSSIAGWKEDFMISFTRTRAQELALEYLRAHLDPGVRFYVGGHSKGANLTLYAACLLDDERQARILHLYINDGPGLCPEVLSPALLARIDERATMIVPEYCIIGKLFAPRIPDTRIVKSTAKTLAQHSIFSWGFENGALAPADTHSPHSLRANEVIDRWLTGVPTEQRSRVTDELFAALAHSGAESLFDLVQMGPTAFEDVLITLINADPVAKKALMLLPAAAVETELDEGFLTPDTKTIPGFFRSFSTEIAMGAAGLTLALLPPGLIRWALALLLFAVAAWETAVTVRLLHRKNWELHREQTRVTLCIVLLVLLALSFVREQALLVLVSAVAGGVMLLYAFLSAAHMQKSRGHRLRFWMYLAEGIFALFFGLMFLLAQERTVGYYTDAFGFALLADCALHVLVRRHEAKTKKEADKTARSPS